MSNYEGMNGNGKVTKKQIKELKEILIKAYNLDIFGITPKVLKEYGLKKASSRTLNFPMVKEFEEGEYDIVGSITLNPQTGEFHFHVVENNHAMNDVCDIKVYSGLMHFIRQLPSKGKTYGAKTHYWSELDEDEYGNKTGGHYQYYGAWDTPTVYAY